jgi:tryptophan synthase alpha chain
VSSSPSNRSTPTAHDLSSVAFEKARAEGRSALIGYLPAGFPTVPGAIDAIKAMIDNGVDIVEVGLPYSDPVMDGPVIQRATEAALAGGFRVADGLRTVEAVAAAGAPILVMTYWNLVERYGVERFSADLAAAGGAGLITPDLIPDESAPWLEASDAHDLDRVFLVSPSSTDARIAMTAGRCRGFVYATSVMGVTGARTSTSTAAPALVERIRAASKAADTNVPVAVGLGVSNGDQAAEVGAFADGVIVGSALVRCLQDAATPAEGVAAIAALSADLAEGVRRR